MEEGGIDDSIGLHRGVVILHCKHSGIEQGPHRPTEKY